jgi:hypothetical protein
MQTYQEMSTKTDQKKNMILLLDLVDHPIRLAARRKAVQWLSLEDTMHDGQ